VLGKRAAASGGFAQGAGHLEFHVFRDRYDVTVETVETAREDVEFKVPRALREPA